MTLISQDSSVKRLCPEAVVMCEELSKHSGIEVIHRFMVVDIKLKNGDMHEGVVIEDNKFMYGKKFDGKLRDQPFSSRDIGEVLEPDMAMCV